MSKNKLNVLIFQNSVSTYRYYGSLVAAPYVGQIFAKIFEYKQIKPTEAVKEFTYSEMPALVGETAGRAIKTINALGLHLEISGTGGTVVAQYPLPGEIINENSVVLLALSED